MGTFALGLTTTPTVLSLAGIPDLAILLSEGRGLNVDRPWAASTLLSLKKMRRPLRGETDPAPSQGGLSIRIRES